MDEVYTVLAVRTNIETGDDTLPSGITYSCSFYCTPSSWIVSSFSDTGGAHRALSVIFGSLSIVAIFFATRVFSNARIALITSVFVIFSSIHIAWAREARWYTELLFLLWSSLWLLHMSLAERGNKVVVYGATAGAFALATVYVHPISLSILPLYAALLCIKSKLSPWKTCVAALTCIGVSLYIFKGPIVALAKNITISNQSFFYISHIIHEYYPLLIIGLIGIVYAYFRNIQIGSREMIHIALLQIAWIVPLFFLTDRVEYRYIFPLTPFIYMFAAWSIHTIASSLKAPILRQVTYIGIPIAIMVASSGFTILPQTIYALESDLPSETPNRHFYAYTPQPNWRVAYEYIETHKSKDDIIISSLPAYTWLHFNERGYWLSFDHITGDNSHERSDQYVGAPGINSVDALRELTSSSHGYIVFDFMAQDNRINPAVLTYITDNYPLVFFDEVNEVSSIFVYRF